LKFHFLDHGGIILFYESVVDFFISLKLSLKYLNVSMYNCVQLNSSFFPGLLLRKLLSILLITYPRMPCMIFSRCPYSLVPLIYLELVPFFLLQGLYLITFDIYMFEILKGTYMTSEIFRFCFNHYHVLLRYVVPYILYLLQHANPNLMRLSYVKAIFICP
jgi:hypothetical protein